jgi:hypothetical protein
MDIELSVWVDDREVQDNGTVKWHNYTTQRILVTGTTGKERPLIDEATEHLKENLRRMMGCNYSDDA